MWSLRRMEHIPWVDRFRTDDVLRRAGEERELFEIIKKCKIGYLGHIRRGAKYENTEPHN